MVEKQEKIVAYIGIILVFILVNFAGFFLTPTVHRLLLFIGFGVWLFYLYRSRSRVVYPRILLPLSAFVTYRLVMTPLSPQPVVNLDLVLSDLILLLVFVLVFASLGRNFRPEFWENTLVIFAILFSTIELLPTLDWYSRWWQITGSLPPFGYRIPGLIIGHPNTLAGFLILVMPIVVRRIIREPGRVKRPLWTFGLFIFLVTIFFASSRAGWVAGLFGMATAVVLIYGNEIVPIIKGKSEKSIKEILPTRSIAIGVGSILLALGFTYLLLQQAQTIPTHTKALGGARADIWGTALETFTASPIWGNGPGSFTVLRAELTQLPPGFGSSHAHNILLHTASELGLVGVGLLLWIFFTLAYGLYKAWLANPASRPQLAAYVGAFVALSLQHLLVFLFYSHFYTFSVFILMALALHHAPPTEKRHFERKWIIIVPVLLMLLALAGIAYARSGDFDYMAGVKAGSQGDWGEARQRICLAYDKMPDITLSGFQCTLANAEVYFRSGDPEYLQEAISIQRSALERDPSWPVHWANLAALEWTVGDQTQAIEQMESALDAAPRNATFALNLGWMYETIGSADEAVEAYVQALEADPWLQFGIPFAESASAKTALTQYLDSLEQGAEPLTFEGWRALYEGNLGSAEGMFNQSIEEYARDSLAYAGLALVDQRMGRLESAQENIEKALFIDSSSTRVLHAAGVVSLAQGLDEEAFGYFQQALDSINEKTYSESHYYSAFARSFLPSDLVPQMRRGGLTQELVDSFLLLEEHYAERGEYEKAAEVQIRMEVELE